MTIENGEKTLADLDAEREEIEEDIANIRAQLERAAQVFKDTGVRADGEWFRKARHALRCRGQDHQSILREIGALNRKRREQAVKKNIAASRNYFREAAREMLTDAQFKMIVERAMELAGSEERTDGSHQTEN